MAGQPWRWRQRSSGTCAVGSTTAAMDVTRCGRATVSPDLWRHTATSGLRRGCPSDAVCLADLCHGHSASLLPHRLWRHHYLLTVERDVIIICWHLRVTSSSPSVTSSSLCRRSRPSQSGNCVVAPCRPVALVKPSWSSTFQTESFDENPPSRHSPSRRLHVPDSSSTRIHVPDRDLRRKSTFQTQFFKEIPRSRHSPSTRIHVPDRVLRRNPVAYFYTLPVAHRDHNLLVVVVSRSPTSHQRVWSVLRDVCLTAWSSPVNSARRSPSATALLRRYTRWNIPRSTSTNIWGRLCLLLI